MKWSRVWVFPLFFLPWLAVAGGLIFFLLLRFPLNGMRSFYFAFDGSSPWFEPFLPAERVLPAGPQTEGWTGQRILMDPVYAGLRLPGVFDTVNVGLELRTFRQSVVELGIIRRLDPFEAEMQPIWNERLQTGWREVDYKGQHGFVREGYPDSMLLEADMDQVLTWYATTTASEQMDTTSTQKTWATSLRGSHDIYFIPVNGKADFTFHFQDMNRAEAGNQVSFRLMRDEELLQTDALSLSGYLDKRPNQVVEKTFHFSALGPGVYRLALTASDDVFVRSITTNAKHWVLGPRFFSGDTVGWSTSTLPVAVWTNSRHVAVETFHNEGKQTVSLGQATIRVNDTHQSYALDRQADELAGDVLLSAPQGNIRVIGDGYVAFEREALFLPKPRRLTDASDPLKEGILAVLTPYHRPQVLENGWVKTNVSYRLPQGVESYKLALAAPGILSRSGAVDIRAIELDYQRPAMSWGTVWYYLKQELAAAWRRL